MKTWQISDEIVHDGALSALIEKSRSTLEDVIGPYSRDHVNVNWSTSKAGDKPVVWLTLSDWEWPEGKRAALDPTELGSHDLSYRKFLRLWSDFLQARNYQQLKRLQELVKE